MTTDTTSPRSLGAVMSGETGFEVDPNDSPFRVSGFISLLLGLLSGFTIVAIPMVGFAIAAILFGLFALRKSDSKAVPTGTTAARIGILVALLFGSWGAARFAFKANTLGSQAEHCAREFVKVASSGNLMYAKELQKSYVNRYLKTMPLEEHYRQEQQRKDEEMQSQAAQGLGGSSEEDDSTVPDLVKYPVDHKWYLYRPVRVYTQWGRQKAEVILAADQSEKPFRLMVVMEYLVHKEDGTGQWHVENCVPFSERIVAESIL